MANGLTTDLITKSNGLSIKEINMLKDKIDLKFISSVTSFSEDELLKLKSTI
jgi:hypothetical protein